MAKNKKLKIQRNQFSGWSSILWLLFFFWIFYYLFGNLDNQALNLSYTEFKNQVKQGNISEITIKEEQVTGDFNIQYAEVDEASNDTTRYETFVTTIPAIEDAELMALLEQNDVEVNAEPSSDGSWWTTMLIIFLPWVLIIAYFAYVRKRMRGQFKGLGGGLFKIGKSRAKRYEKSSSDVTFEDVAGLDNAKKDLQEIIDYLKEPEKFAALGADIPKGVLLMGSPGTGKTLLARATAGEAEVAFFSISGSEFIEMFVGVGASRVRDMFENAKKEAPSIIFIDEIDSIGRARGTGLGGGHDEREQTLNQVLSEMDGFAPNESVVVMAATNRPDVLDSALTRPGRFDRQITIELPQKKAREKILEIHTRKVPLAEDVDLTTLAARTVGFSGAELRNLVNEAALLAGRKKKSEVEPEDMDEARDKILLGQVREESIQEDEKKVIAYHEAGHALMAKLIPDSDPVKKVTIIPRGRSLGATEQMPEEDRHNHSKKYLLNRLAILLGGRAAEKLVFTDITTGAAQDLKQATSIAQKMVCQWGMSERLGPVAFRRGEEHMFLGREMTHPKDFSEETARIIDEEIQRIIQEMEKKAIETLENNRENLDAIAAALLEHETLENEQIDKLIETNSNSKTDDQAHVLNLNSTD